MTDLRSEDSMSSTSVSTPVGSGIPRPRKRVEPVDPLAISESLGVQTFRRETRRPFTKEEDDRLTELVNRYYGDKVHDLNLDLVDWEFLSKELEPNGSRKPKMCRKRWANSLDPNLKKGKWSPEEDELLIRTYQKYGATWLRVASEIPGRTDDQCAKRYTEVLDPSTKDRLKSWTQEEDLKLISLVKIHGTKWRTICTKIAGRPALTCRNRWRKLLTDVVRGKSSDFIKRQVQSITDGLKLEATASISNEEDQFTKPAASGSMENSTLSQTSKSIQAGSSSILSTIASVLSANSVGTVSASPSVSASTSVSGIAEQAGDQVALASRSKPEQRTSSESTREVEWRYTIMGGEDADLPHKRLFNSCLLYTSRCV